MLLSFSDLFLKKNFDEPVATPQCHLEWWDLACSEEKYVAIAAPRGHAKSTAISHVYVLANICLRVKRHVLIVSDTEGQASMFLLNIKKELEENEDLRKAFKVRDFLKASETELIVRWDDGSKTRVIARGAGQSIRGTNWEGKRPDLVVGDDLENDEAVMNEERREKFSNWFQKVLLPAAAKSCHFRIVGTILHEDSLLAGLMPDQIEDPNVEESALQVWTTTERAWKAVLYRAHPDFDDFSELLWSEQHSEASLRQVRQTYIDRGSPEGYAQEYLNNPMADEGAYFQEDDLLPMLYEELNAESRSPEHFYIGCDFAISEKSRRAFTVFAVCGIGPDSTLRIREIIRKRMDALDICDTMFRLHTKYRRKAAMNAEPVFLVESENIAKSVGPFLYERMALNDQPLLIEMMKPIKDKELRGRSLQARTRAHMVEFDHTADWWPTLKHEMLTFPRSTYKDQVDALAWVGHWVANMNAAPDWEEIEDEEYYAEMAEAEADWGAGRNPITGY
jgi:predicted phage terminase large subunit-like protein